ncbi:MAG TPA: hypothetical protein VNP95_03210, partial [Thermomicrobiales bacterium]|nr:hypothetical protein [Thermomicrobiales bacterium]
MSTVSSELPQSLPGVEHDIPATKSSAVAIASPRRLMWLKFRRHKLAMVGMVSIGLLYLMAIFAGFLSPVGPDTRSKYPYASPNGIHWFDGGSFSPHVYGLTAKTVPGTMNRSFVKNPDEKIPVHFFVRGEPYTILGVIKTDIRLFGAEDGGLVALFGTDKLGRDVYSRVLAGAGISLSIGLVGVAISFVLGAIIGGFSGYYGGWFDTLVQRIIEFI